MAIVLQSAVDADLTITASDILAAIHRDTRNTLNNANGETLLLDYLDRIHRMIVRRRKWDWLQSAPKRFVTEVGQTDYWIGASGSADAGQVDTALNLSDVYEVKVGSVIDRSGLTPLHREEEPPFHLLAALPDASYQQGPPLEYRYDSRTPNVLSIYPQPDEGNDYEMIPAPPHSTTAAGGSLDARTYFIKVTFVDLEGNESAASSPAARQFVEASKIITVKAPQPPVSTGTAGISYLRYNVYVGTTEGSETLQNGSPTAITADWTEDVTGLTSNGASAPTTSSIEPLRGYVIDFRYIKKLSPINDTGDILLIPDRYIDVVKYGVNWLAFKYLKMPEDSAEQKDLFDTGIQQMVMEQNPWPGGKMYIRPDTTMIRSTF